ncbi:MAG: hypothetical protein ACC608_03695 [Anaerofustis sp.]
MKELTVLEVLEDIKENNLDFLPEEAKDGYLVALKFFMLAI